MSVLLAFRSWIACGLLGLVIAVPLVGLGATALLDRSPDGVVRASIFPTAIAALDPFIGECARNSVFVAGLAAATSMLIGVFVGRLTADWRFPARGLIVGLLTISTVVQPTVIALGLSILFRRPGWGWGLWLWSACVQGGAITAAACLAAQSRLDPAWREAARIAGGTRERAWRKLSWPLLRPFLARAGGLVFALTIADPGAPLVLGLRRTLGYQMIATTSRSEPFPRLAVLALIALVLSVIAHVVLTTWGRTEFIPKERSIRSSNPLRVASLRRSLTGSAFVVAWCVFAGAPLATLAAASLGAGSIRLLSSPSLVQTAANSVVLGALVGLLFALAGWLTRLLPKGRNAGASERLLGLLTSGVAPPLVMGVVALSLFRLAGMLVGPPESESTSNLASMARNAALAVASGRIPFLGSAIGVWLAMIPSLLRIWEGGRVDEADHRDRVAAALLAGASRSKAHRLASAWSRGDSVRLLVLTICLAATNVAPAVLLAQNSSERTIGPEILIDREDPDLESTAAALAFLATALNVGAVWIGSPGRLQARYGASSDQRGA